MKGMRRNHSYGWWSALELAVHVWVGGYCHCLVMLVYGGRVRGLEWGKVGWWISGARKLMKSSFGRAHQSMGGSLSLGHKDRPPYCIPPYLSCLSLTAASMDASPALCAPSRGWDLSWILMLVLTAGQGFAILVLSIMLWRQRVQRAQCRGESLPPRGKKSTWCKAEG